MTARDDLHTALDIAIRHIGEVMGEPYAVHPSLSVEEDTAFWALAEPDGIGGLYIQASTAVADGIAALWQDALRQGVVLIRDGEPLVPDAETLSHVSLVWLMLHELSHFDLGHFALNGGAGIVENHRARGISSRVALKPAPIDALDTAHRPYVDP